MCLVKQAIELNNEILNLYLMDCNHMLRIVTQGLSQEINYKDALNNFSKAITLSSEQQNDPFWVKEDQKLKSFLHQKTNINKRENFFEFLKSFQEKTDDYIFLLSANNSQTDSQIDFQTSDVAYKLIMEVSKKLNVYIDTLKDLLLNKGNKQEILKCIDTFVKNNGSMINSLKEAKFDDNWSLNIVQNNFKGLLRVDDNLERLGLKQHNQKSDLIPIKALEILEKNNLLKYSYLFNIECKSGITGSDYLNIITYFEMLEHHMKENSTNIFKNINIASSSNQNLCTVKNIFDTYKLNKPIGGFNIAPNLLNSKNLIFIDVFDYENIFPYQYNYYCEQKLWKTHKWACDHFGLDCDLTTLISQYPHKFKKPIIEHVFSNNLSETLNIFKNNIDEIQSLGTGRLIENNPVLDKENNFNVCVLKANFIDGLSSNIDNNF